MQAGRRGIRGRPGGGGVALGDRPGRAVVHARTTRWARERYEKLLFLVGADQFARLDTWYRPDDVLELARLAIATRPGFPHDELDQVRAALRDPDRVEFFEIEPWPVSSTRIRDRVRRGEPIDDVVLPAPVALLIDELALYRA